MTPDCLTVVVPRIDPDGTLRFVADLGVAVEAARWSTADTVIRLRSGRPTGVARTWSESLARGARAVVVLTEGLGSPGESVASQVPGAHVVPADRLGEALRALLPGAARAPRGVCPYARGVLNRGDASEAGIDLRLDTDPTLFAALRGGPSAAVPPQLFLHALVRGGRRVLRNARGASTEAVVRTFVGQGWGCVVVLRAGDLTVGVAAWLREVGVERVRLDLSENDSDALRSAVVAAASTGLELVVEIDLHRWYSPLPVAARAIAEAAHIWPRTEVRGAPQLLRELVARAGLVGVRGDAVVAQRVREDVRRTASAGARLIEERYPEVPLLLGPHDVWWENEDDPAAHRRWLAEVLPLGGRVHRVARGEVVGWDGEVALRGGQQIVGYGEVGLEDRSALGFLRTDQCVDAFVADAERAWRTGDPPSRFLGHVGGLCQVGGPCWSAGGRRLYVDPGGALRTRPGGPEVGVVGDGFRPVRRRVRGALARCCSTPRSRRIPRVLATRAALRWSAPTERPRASGWGGPLLHPYGAALDWPPGIALVRSRGRFVVHDAARGTRADLDEARAHVLELIFDLGDRAAPVLTRLVGSPFSAEQVALARGTILARLSGRTGDEIGL